MKLDMGLNWLHVKREEGEKRAYSESGFWVQVKVAMRKAGYDVIKKRPDADGHLTSAPYYVRSRTRSGRQWCIFDPNHQVRSPHTDYNAGNLVSLQVHGTPFLQDERLRCPQCGSASEGGGYHGTRFCPEHGHFKTTAPALVADNP